MSDAVLSSLITGGLALLGVVITCLATSHKQEKAQAVAQAVMDTKITELTREVRSHNGFATKIPVMEAQIEVLQDKVATLEKYHMQ